MTDEQIREELNRIRGTTDQITVVNNDTVCVRVLPAANFPRDIPDETAIEIFAGSQELLYYTCQYNYANEAHGNSVNRIRNYEAKMLYCPDSEVSPHSSTTIFSAKRNISSYGDIPCECLMPSGMEMSKNYITRTPWNDNDGVIEFDIKNYEKPASPKPDQFATKQRFIGRTNRLLGGIMIKQTKGIIKNCEQANSTNVLDGSKAEHYEHMHAKCMKRNVLKTSPYGVDPVFLSTSALYDTVALTKQMSSGAYYDKSDPSLFDNTTGAPFMFHYDHKSEGYVVWIDSNLDEAKALKWVEMLEEGFFITPETLSLDIVIPSFNPASNSLSLSKIQLQWETYGGISLSETSTVINLDTEDDAVGESGTSHRFYLTWMALVLMIFFDVCGELKQLYEEAKDNNWNPCSYFKSIWNILDWLNLIFFILMISRKINLIVAVQLVRQHAAARYNVYSDLRATANWLKPANYSNVDPRLEAHGHFGGMDQVTQHFSMYDKMETLSQNLSDVSLFCTLTMLFRFLKVLDFQPKLALVSATISKAAINLYYFFIVFLSQVGGFAVCGYLIFGKSSPYFSSPQNAITTCINMFMGDLDADGQMSETHLVFSWKIYYYSFLCITFFVLLNILLAIIVDAYVEVKDAATDSSSVSEDLIKILKNPNFCRTKQENREKLVQLLDPTRSTVVPRNKNDTSNDGGGGGGDEVRSMTAVAPEGSQDLENLKNRKKNKNKNKQADAGETKSIKVHNEVGPSHTVAFEISKEFLLRTFVGENDGAMKNEIDEMFRLLSSSKNSFDMHSNSDSDEDDDDLFNDLGHCEEIALKKRRSKQVLAYLVEKHLRKKQQDSKLRESRTVDDLGGDAAKFIPPGL